MTTALVLLLAYLLGSIPTGLIIGKIFFKTDIREHGSGNLGGTNTFRVLGKPAGLIVSLIDILKGTAAVLLVALPVFADVGIHPLILGAIAVIGHMYPVFAGFRGGKAVATSAGVLLGYNWLFFLILLGLFFLLLKLTKMVSLTSILLSLIAFLMAVGSHFLIRPDVPLILLISVLLVFIVYRHRANITRIRQGTEPKITWI
ncbi:glycerol-3-phosphate 1-O-acyltransferase PlsY [Chryseomicrobium aureum]|uniref:glycerol-3-phosphate 1-O-acyltransferase PlsY n=1 Tax=Chryseomicrobium aureum TaxID=1441723 RepID=UPI0035968A75